MDPDGENRYFAFVKPPVFFFVVITAAEIVFTLTYFLLTGEIDKIILIGLLIYAAAMVAGFISYRVGKYRRRKKELLDSLP